MPRPKTRSLKQNRKRMPVNIKTGAMPRPKTRSLKRPGVLRWTPTKPRGAMPRPKTRSLKLRGIHEIQP